MRQSQAVKVAVSKLARGPSSRVRKVSWKSSSASALSFTSRSRKLNRRRSERA